MILYKILSKCKVMKTTDNPSIALQAIEAESLLYRTVNRIRQTEKLQEILAATVIEVRSYLATDRVIIYRFDRDESGEVIAESIQDKRLPSLLGLHFPSDDIPASAREMFLKARQRSIVDVASRKIGLSPLDCTNSGELLPNDNIQYRLVDPCHIEYLKSMGVQSSLVLPLVYQDATDVLSQPQLWGLLVSHHSQPRTILKRELRTLQQITDQLSIAIAQSNLFAQICAEKNRQSIINGAIAQLHSLPTIQLQAALETTVEALGGCGGRIYIEATGELYSWGVQPTLPEPFQNSILEQHPFWQHWMSEFRRDSVWAISDLYKEPQLRVLATAFKATQIRGLLIMPLGYHQNLLGVISVFRKEYDTKVLWAGQREQNTLQQLPQISFETWCEQRNGQAPEWQPEDISLAQTLCYHFSMAIQQQHMYQQVQGLNLNLKQQVNEQTTELEKSLLMTNAVKLVSEQIRSTLDLKITLQTIVREVRQLLNADRILIYQLSDKLDGEVVVEELSGSWKSVISVKAPADCFLEEYGQLYFRGIRAINNVATVSLSPCHREFLESLQVQANLIVPINMGESLWGLLIAHQCQAPRKWYDDEIELLQQLADQAAIAIQQAQLYEQSRSAENIANTKAMQLGQALYDLQQTQTQLIQSEKMSSLGQLVAGVAHEINNPVNFIYGNLSHANNYTQQLIELLNIYQKQYPQPNCEIDTKAEEIDLEYVTVDLPKIISSMRIGAERISDIVLSLRNFSRLDEAEMKPVNLHEGINNTLLILQHRLNHINCPGIQVIKQYDDLPLIECYAGQLNQVFMHLLNNAIDALAEKAKHNFSNIPKILISTEKSLKNPTVIIRIADNGMGISEEVKTRIFDPFFTTKEVGKGIGLGLAISYQIIVEKHGGIIKCISKQEKGTEFLIEIPLQQK